MKKILILGAGVYQVPLIKAARNIGLYTIVMSIPGEYPGFALADKVIYEDTADAEAVLDIAKKEGISGICTTGTDVCIHTVGVVNEALGLRGLGIEGSTIAGRKALMKDVYMEHGVNTARYRHVLLRTPIEGVARICGKIGYPVVFKAIDSSGSRGITRVDGPDGIEKAIESVKAVTRSDEYLIEENLDGEEYGAEAFVQDGKLEFMLLNGKYIFKGATGVPVGHYAPYGTPDIEKRSREQLEKAVRAMKLNNCAVNVDFMRCGDTVYVLEIGARGGGTCLGELVSLYYGYDYYEKMIRVAMGEKVDFAPANKVRVPNASHLLMSGRTGTIRSITDDNEPSEDIFDISFDHRPGDHVTAFSIGPHRIGQVITTGPTVEDAQRTLWKAIGRIHIEIE